MHQVVRFSPAEEATQDLMGKDEQAEISIPHSDEINIAALPIFIVAYKQRKRMINNIIYHKSKLLQCIK